MKHKQSPKQNFLYKQVVNQYPNINLQKKPLVQLKQQPKNEQQTTIVINKQHSIEEQSENLKIAKDDSRLEGLKLDLNMTSYLNELGESSSKFVEESQVSDRHRQISAKKITEVMDSSHSDKPAGETIEEIFQSYDQLTPQKNQLTITQHKPNRRQIVKDGELSSNSLQNSIVKSRLSTYRLLEDAERDKIQIQVNETASGLKLKEQQLEIQVNTDRHNILYINENKESQKRKVMKIETSRHRTSIKSRRSTRPIVSYTSKMTKQIKKQKKQRRLKPLKYILKHVNIRNIKLLRYLIHSRKLIKHNQLKKQMNLKSHMLWHSSSANSTLQRSVKLFKYTRYQIQHLSPFSTFTGTARSNLQVKFIERTHSSETYDSSPSGSSPQNTQTHTKGTKRKNIISNNIKIFNQSQQQHKTNLTSHITTTVTDQTPDSHSQLHNTNKEVADIFEKQEKDKALDDLLVSVQNQFLNRRLSYLQKEIKIVEELKETEQKMGKKEKKEYKLPELHEKVFANRQVQLSDLNYEEMLAKFSPKSVLGKKKHSIPKLNQSPSKASLMQRKSSPFKKGSNITLSTNQNLTEVQSMIQQFKQSGSFTTKQGTYNSGFGVNSNFITAESTRYPVSQQKREQQNQSLQRDESVKSMVHYKLSSLKRRNLSIIDQINLNSKKSLHTQEGVENLISMKSQLQNYSQKYNLSPSQSHLKEQTKSKKNLLKLPEIGQRSQVPSYHRNSSTEKLLSLGMLKSPKMPKSRNASLSKDLRLNLKGRTVNPQNDLHTRYPSIQYSNVGLINPNNLNLYSDLMSHIRKQPLKAVKIIDPQLNVPRIIIEKTPQYGEEYFNIQEDSIQNDVNTGYIDELMYIHDRPGQDIDVEKHNLTFAAEQKQVTPKDVAASKLVDFDTKLDMQRTNVKSKSGENGFLDTTKSQDKSQVSKSIITQHTKAESIYKKHEKRKINKQPAGNRKNASSRMVQDDKSNEDLKQVY